MKKIILAFILGGLIFGSIGIYAVSFLASDISYAKEGWEVENVNEALDSLYDNIQNSTKKALVFTSSPVDMTQYTDRWAELTTADFKAVFTKASVSFKAYAPDGQTDHDSSVSASVTPTFSYNASTGQLTFSNKSAATNHTSGGSYVEVKGTLNSTANVIWLGTVGGE